MASQDALDWETEKDRRRNQKHTSSRERQLKAHEEKEKAEKEAENWVREKEAEWERRRLAAVAKQSPPSSQVSPSPEKEEEWEARRLAVQDASTFNHYETQRPITTKNPQCQGVVAEPSEQPRPNTASSASGGRDGQGDDVAAAWQAYLMDEEECDA